MPTCDKCGADYEWTCSCNRAPQTAPCPRCKAGTLWLNVAKPNSGTGCIIVILGLVLSPILIGIPIAIYGYLRTQDTIRTWHCRGCGTVFPA